jgi:hypothetical protein
MRPAEFEPTFPANERMQTKVSDRAARRSATNRNILKKFLITNVQIDRKKVGSFSANFLWYEILKLGYSEKMECLILP